MMEQQGAVCARDASLVQVLVRYRVHLIAMVMVAFLVRALLFSQYMGEESRFNQPDTASYHAGAMSLFHNKGFVQLPSGEPIFWRTPGYPWFLATMYRDGVDRGITQLEDLQRRALWLQLAICSLLPLLMFLFAYVLTTSSLLALIVGWIAVFHVGFVATSTHLQTDGLALMFLVPFMILFYRSFVFSRTHQPPTTWILSLAGAALFLGLYTWIRPMGMFVAQLSSLILIVSHDTWFNKLKKLGVMWCMFLAVIGGWYVRNYQLTGQVFYNPTFGPTLGLFCVPKIMRATTGKCLHDCWQEACRQMYFHTLAQTRQAQLVNAPSKIVKELTAVEYARPFIVQHPFLFIRDWMVQVVKTSFDLYSHLLVSCVKKTQWYDELEDFLTVKLAECLSCCPVPWWIRALAWTELLFMILMWGGFFAGFVLFLLFAHTSWRLPNQLYREAMISLWLKVGLMAGGLLMMTGAFGYARLRLPVDILVIILSLTFWWWAYESFVAHRRA